ncbi:hypothetical protein Mapa_010858 [Marchantia paleacea]|nr:hypothetical protein Mapa_010858 [Marchantia paleacea]
MAVEVLPVPSTNWIALVDIDMRSPVLQSEELCFYGGSSLSVHQQMRETDSSRIANGPHRAPQGFIAYELVGTGDPSVGIDRIEKVRLDFDVFFHGETSGHEQSESSSQRVAHDANFLAAVSGHGTLHCRHDLLEARRLVQALERDVHVVPPVVHSRQSSSDGDHHFLGRRSCRRRRVPSVHGQIDALLLLLDVGPQQLLAVLLFLQADELEIDRLPPKASRGSASAEVCTIRLCSSSYTPLTSFAMVTLRYSSFSQIDGDSETSTDGSKGREVGTWGRYGARDVGDSLKLTEARTGCEEVEILRDGLDFRFDRVSGFWTQGL